MVAADINVGGDVAQRDVAVVVVDLDVAFAVSDGYIAMVDLEIGSSLSRQVDFQVRLLRRATPEADLDLGTLLAAAAAQRDHVAFGRKSGLVIFKKLLGGGF